MTELTQRLAAHSHALTVTIGRRLAELRHDERGSFTIEQVLWAAAAIGFVTVVVTAINYYLGLQVAKIH